MASKNCASCKWFIADSCHLDPPKWIPERYIPFNGHTGYGGHTKPGRFAQPGVLPVSS